MIKRLKLVFAMWVQLCTAAVPACTHQTIISLSGAHRGDRLGWDRLGEPTQPPFQQGFAAWESSAQVRNWGS